MGNWRGGTLPSPKHCLARRQSTHTPLSTLHWLAYRERNHRGHNLVRISSKDGAGRERYYIYGKRRELRKSKTTQTSCASLRFRVIRFITPIRIIYVYIYIFCVSIYAKIEWCLMRAFRLLTKHDGTPIYKKDALSMYMDMFRYLWVSLPVY